MQGQTNKAAANQQDVRLVFSVFPFLSFELKKARSLVAPDIRPIGHVLF